MIESIQDLWNIIAPYVTNGAVFGAIASILGAVISRAIKNRNNETKAAIVKIEETYNNEKVAEQVTNNMKDYFKNITISQDIQPLVQSELVKVTETANEYIKQQLKETQEGYNKLLVIVEKLAAYFDNSIGVPEEAKEALKEAIAEAKIPDEPVHEIASQVVVEEQPQEIVIEKETKKSKKKTADIER